MTTPTNTTQADETATLRRLITQEIAMWDERSPEPMTYAKGVRDGLNAALTYLDSLANGSAEAAEVQQS